MHIEDDDYHTQPYPIKFSLTQKWHIESRFLRGVEVQEVGGDGVGYVGMQIVQPTAIVEG